MKRHLGFLILISLLAFDVQAQESSYLFGDWNGQRKQLVEKGMDFNLAYKGEASQILRGGSSHHTDYLENIDVKLALDADKLVGWQGGSIFIYGLGNRRARQDHSPATDSGAYQGLSNIETSYNAFKLYEFYVEQKLLSDRLSFLFGLHDLNSEFYVTESASLFLNPSFGIGAEMAQTGVNGPSIFPNAALAFRVKWQISEQFYIQAAAFDGQAGDPSAPHSNVVINHTPSEGQLLITEFGYADTEKAVKYALGVWRYTHQFDHLTETEINSNNEVVPVHKISQGTYALMNQKMSDMLSGFVRYGMASSETNPVVANLGLGVVAEGLIPGRERDRFGIGYTGVLAGSPYKDQLKTSGVEPADSEEIFEISYRAELGRGIALQPTFQKILNPGMDAQKSSVDYGAIRLEINF